MEKEISIAIQPGFYNTFANQASTVPHAIAEFIDNALQSYRDHKQVLHVSDPDYRPHVIIEIGWNPVTQVASYITIRDNAFGMDEENFMRSMQPGNKPSNTTGLHEFGMGLKSATLWLGKVYSITTKAYGEDVVRSATFDLDEVTSANLQKVKFIETPADPQEHYTIIDIKHMTQNAPKQHSQAKIIDEIASIYREVLRANELGILINNNPVYFEEYEVLNVPYVKDPDGKPKMWRKDIDFTFQKYHARGFIGLLKEIDSAKNGLVLFRRGRAIVGAGEGQRKYPKSLFGAPGTFRYKRLFGELELEGFEVSYNKNEILNAEDLDALFVALVDEIRQPGFDFFTQAQEYRVGQIKKAVKSIVRKHEDAKKKVEQPASITITPSKEQTEPPKTPENKDILDSIHDIYYINEEEYKLKVQMVQSGEQICWIDVSRMEIDHLITCNINVAHEFFQNFGTPNSSTIALLKTLAIARVAAAMSPGKSASDMLNYFNQFISQTKA